MHPLHPYLAICNSPNILCCSHDFVSFCMDYLLHMSYVYLFICLVNFSFVMTQLEGCLFRELFLISSGRTWCFFPGISILFMTLSLSMCYAVHLPEKWLSNFNVPSKQELNLQKFKVMAPTIRNPDPLDQDGSGFQDFNIFWNPQVYLLHVHVLHHCSV